jgi:hypothetical protein
LCCDMNSMIHDEHYSDQWPVLSEWLISMLPGLSWMLLEISPHSHFWFEVKCVLGRLLGYANLRVGR